MENMQLDNYYGCLEVPGPEAQCLSYQDDAKASCTTMGLDSCSVTVGFNSLSSPSYSWPYCLPDTCDAYFSQIFSSNDFTVQVVQNCSSVTEEGTSSSAASRITASDWSIAVLLIALLVNILF